MRRAIVVRRRLTDSQTIVLDEPVEGVDVEVEVVLREALPPRPDETGESLVAVVRRADLEDAMRKDLDVEVLHAPAAASSEDVTESPVVLGRRVSATIRTGPPVTDDGPPSGE